MSLEIRSLAKNSIVGKAKNITFCSSLNCFIIVNERGEYFVTDSSMELIFGPILSGCSTALADYSRLHDCLIVFDNRKLSSRRDIGGTFLLKTALNERFHGPIDDETEVDVELTSSETAKLFQYLLSPGIKLSTEKSRDILAQLKKQLPESKDIDKSSRSGKWSTVVIHGEYGFLHTMFSSIVSDLRQTNSRTPVLPVAAAIIERLNLMKDEPYSFELNSEGSGYEKSSMASEAARRMTLARWPHMNYKWCLPDQMAEAGFYHQPNNGGDDRVMCFMCNVCLVCWEPSDEPWSEHERHAPNCAFIREEYTYNVPISVTYASATAIDHGCSSDISVISSQSNCDWLATSTKCGEVVLWNIAKELQKTDVLTLDPSDSFVEMETGYRPRPPKSAKVAWADDAENTTVYQYGAHEAVVADTLRDFIDMSANEIANEIVAVCPQKGDINVTSLCCVGKLNSKDDASQDYGDIMVSPMTSSFSTTPSMIVGCGILEAKLNQHQDFIQNQRNKNLLDQQNFSSSSPSSTSPMSSFVQNLNTVNKSRLGEVIVPPTERSVSIGGGSSADEFASATSSSLQYRSYRPFILVYKIEEVKDTKRRVLPIGLSQNEKNKFRSGDDKNNVSSSMTKSLSEVFGLGGQSGGYGIPADAFFDQSDNIDVTDDGSSYGKDALIEAAMDLNYEMVNFMNNNAAFGSPPSSGGGSGGNSVPPKFTVPPVAMATTPPTLLSDELASAVGDLASFSSAGHSQAAAAMMDAWSPFNLPSNKDPLLSSATASSNHANTVNNSKDKIDASTAGGGGFGGGGFGGGGGSPPATDDMLRIEYAKPNVNLVIMQCVRLPANLNDTAYNVHSIVPSLDGAHVFVVVNRHATSPSPSAAKVSSTQIYSAVLMYALTFNNGGASVGVQDRPFRQCLYDHDVGVVRQLMPIPKDSTMTTSSVASVQHNRLDTTVVVLTEKGEILIVDIETGQILRRTSECLEERAKFTSITYVSDDKIGAATETGDIYVLELWSGSKQMDESQQDMYDFNEDAIEELKDSELFVNKPMTYENLKYLWDLTRSEISNVGSQWCVQAPSCWIEVQQHQRLRKCPQHYLREEKMTRSWHIVTDNDTWKEHIFEITLPANYNVSHLDFKFTLRQNTPGPPFVQISLLQQLPRQFSRTSSQQDLAGNSKELTPGTPTMDAEPKVLNGFLKNRIFDENFLKSLNAKVVCGPIDLSVGLDLNDQNGLIQFSSPLFSYSKNRTFLLHIQATCEESETKKYKRRIQQHKKAARIAEQSSLKDTAKATASGMFYQKYGASKTGPFGKALQSGLKVIHQKNLSEVKKLEDLKACDWIQEISLTLWKTKKVFIAEERKQRTAIMQNQSFHEYLFKLFSGESTKFAYPNNSWVHCVVLDILTYVISQIYANSQKIAKNVGKLFGSYLDTMLRSVFLSNSRTVARKFVVFTAFLFKMLKNLSDEEAGMFLSQLKSSLLRMLKFVPACQSSGCLLWLFILLEQTYKVQPNDLLTLSEELLTLLKRLGEEMVKKSNHLHQILFNKYGLNGLPFDLEMFELSLPTLQLVTRPQQPFSYAASTAHGNCLTANFVGQFGNDDLDWADIMGIEYAKSLNSSSNSTTPRKGKMIRLDREHLYGMLEVEPLQFTCQCASEGIRLENIETGLSLTIQTGSVPTSSGPGPIPIPDISQYETMQAGNPALANAVTSMKQQVQNILSKQMQLLALQQEKQKIQGNLQEQVALLAAEPISTTQASSASTFGIPTTPKTTPFMTPTPLSPYQLSPVNSEANMDSFASQFSTDETASAINNAQGAIKDETLNPVPLDFLKPPPAQALLIDRMNSGARKFVVLNFGHPVLLTDFILPQCSDLGSLSVDVWLKSETVDGQRLVVCSDIGRKSFVACDLQPPALCQFLKITYIGRYGLGSCSSKIPLGSFYGYTYLQPWQLDMAADYSYQQQQQETCKPANQNYAPTAAVAELPLSVENLKQLLDDLRCRYGLACCFLKDLLENPTRLWEVTKEQNFDNLLREAYRECMQVKLQYNLIQRTVWRLTSSTAAAPSVVDNQSLARCQQQLSTCSTDKLRVISELVFGCLLRLSPVCRINATPVLNVPLDLDATVEIFEQFCMKGPVSLQALCIIWVLQQAGSTEWWGNFFGNVLDKFKSDSATNSQRCEKVFLMLSYLVERSVASGNDFIFYEILNQLDMILSQSDFLFDRKFVWLIMLLLTGFDYFPRCKIVGDRWNFVLGEYSRANFYTVSAEQHDPRTKEAIKAMNYNIELMQDKALKFTGELKDFMEKTSSAVSPKPIKVAKTVGQPTSSSRSNLSSKLHKRSHKSTLRLPRALCLSVVKKLAACLLRQDMHLTSENFVLFAKVLTAIARCARPYVHIMDVFNEFDVRQLIESSLSARNVCVRHSFVCLVQDFLEMEAMCIRRKAAANSNVVSLGGNDQSSSTSAMSTMLRPSFCLPFASPDSNNIDEACGIDFSAALSNASSASTLSNIAANVLNESMNKPSDLPMPSSTMSSSSSGADLDTTDIPDTPGGAQQMIENLVNSAEPEKVSSSKTDIDMEKRRQELRNMCKESIYSKLASGMPFKQLKLCIKAAQTAEKSIAEKSLTVQQYEKQVQKYVQLHSYGKEYVMDILGSAIFSSAMPTVSLGGGPSGAVAALVPQMPWGDVSPPASFAAMGPPPSGIWMPSLYHPNFPTGLSAAATENLSQAKATLSKLCEHLQTSAAASAILSSSAAASMVASSQDGTGLVDLGSLETFSSLGGVNDSSSSQWKSGDNNLDESDSSSAQVESEPETPVINNSDSFAALSNAIAGSSSKAVNVNSVETATATATKEFVDVDVLEQLNAMQPISLSLDERMESQLGWRYEVEVRRWLLTNNSTLKFCLKTASPSRKPAKFSLVRSDANISHVHLSSSTVLSSTLSEVFETLTENGSTNEFVEDLLQLFWALNPKVSSKKRLDQDSVLSSEMPYITLSESAVERLMNWLIDSVNVSERVWTQTLKTIAFCIPVSHKDTWGRNNTIVSFLLEKNRLEKFLRSFLRAAGSFASTGKNGPVISQTFFDLLQAINGCCAVSADRSLSITFKTILLQCLNEILSVNYYNSLETYPLDVMTKIVEFLHSQQHRTLDIDIVGRLALSASTALKFYLNSCSSCSQPTLLTGVGNPRCCFRLGKTELLTGGVNNEFRSYHDRCDVFMIALVKLIDKFVRTNYLIDEETGKIVLDEPTTVAEIGVGKLQRKSIGEILLTKNRSLVARLLTCLTHCFCESTSTSPGSDTLDFTSKKLQDIEASNVVTVADGVLLLLVGLDAKGGNSKIIVECFVEYLRSSIGGAGVRRPTLTEPLAAFLCYVLGSSNGSVAMDHFVGVDGLNVLAKKFLDSSLSYVSEVCTEETLLLRKAASLCANIQKSISDSSSAMSASGNMVGMATASSATSAALSSYNAPKKLSQMQVEGMTNFAPLSQVVSSSPMAHHLTALLNSTPQHRRARSAAWSYHFYPAESWLDITLTLPYPVVLKEVQLRPHLAALQNCPGSVQVELSPDTDVSSFFLLGPPCITAGCTKIRISTENCAIPVQMVRLHLKRPPDSPNLGISQILLLGHSPLSSENDLSAEKLHWLSLLHFCLNRIDVSRMLKSTNQLASTLISSKLVENLIRSFLCYRFSQNSFEQLVDCIVLLTDADVESSTSLQMIFDVLSKGCFLFTESEIWLVELLNRLCATKASASRLSVLLRWIFLCLTSYTSDLCKLSSRTLSVVVWCTACICWRSTSFVDVQLPSDLLKCLKSVISKCSDVDLKTACGYFLSTICYRHTSEYSKLLQMCGVEKLVSCGNSSTTTTTSSTSTKNKFAKKSPFSSTLAMMSSADDDVSNDAALFDGLALNETDFNLLMLASENPNSVQILLQTKILQSVSARLTKLCQESKPNFVNILNFVEFFCVLSEEEIVSEFLLSPSGSDFWTPLLSCLCNPFTKGFSQSSAGFPVEETTNPDNTIRCLENATVLLLERTIRFKPDGQRLISQIFCNLLSRSSTGGLTSSLQQLVLRILLEDERIKIVINDNKFYASNVTFAHPKFGCGIHLDVREASAHTLCQDLLPLTLPRKTVNIAAKKPPLVPGHWSQNNLYYDYASSVSGGSPFSDVINNGDKAKAKRLANKTLTSGMTSSSSGANKSSPQLQPIAYLCCPTLNDDCLPGKLSLAQLLVHVKKMVDRNFHYLKLKIDYSIPTEINEKTNESLSSVNSVSTVLKTFANMGGLALLAQHLQLYQPSLSLQNTKNTGFYNENELKILEDIDASAAAKQYMGMADEDIIDSYDGLYDWSTGTLVQAGVDPIVGGMESGAHIKPSYERLRSIINVGLSPHVAVCFGVFLRLPGYAELLVTQNNRLAQWLLRLALGVTTDGSGVNILTSNDAVTLSTLPFDVLSSLYDSKKWSSDDGRMIRQVSLELGIVQLLLSCLAAFSHHPPKATTGATASASSEKPEVVRLVDQLLNTLNNAESTLQQSADDKSHLYWAKGTGFGTGSTQRQWNIDLHILKQKQDEQNITCLLKVLTNFLYPGDIVGMVQPQATTGFFTDDNPASCSQTQCPPALEASILPRSLIRALFDSCLTATLQAFLRNDSVLDMSRHTHVYDSVMRVLCAISLCPQLRPILYENSDQQSLKSLLYKLKDCVDTYVSKLEPLKKENIQSSVEESAAEEGLLKLVPLIELAARLVHNISNDEDSNSNSMLNDLVKNGLQLANMPVDEKYMKLMKPLQYDSIKFFDDNGSFTVAFHYESSIKSCGKDVGPLAPRVRRLAQEAVTLSTSLPLSYSSSVFVRCAEERLDVMKVLITGPSGTPYADGCFEFDVWFPNDYPNSPMHINLQTTGGNTVRFNPNLYNDGKVCLSILNTWHGRPEERWNAQTSSFLQVIVSIQSLIFVPDPYFNEPGYERTRGTPAGQQASRDYDANIRIATVRWGMLEMMRNPPAGFKQVIQRHFWLKRDEILKMVELWIAEMNAEGTGTAEKRMQRSTTMQALKRHYYALKEEFAKMQSPLLVNNSLPDGSVAESTSAGSSKDANKS